MNCTFRTAPVTEAKKLYDKFIVPYFPENERRPLWAVRRLMKKGFYKIIVAEESDIPLGIAAIGGYPAGNAFLLDYLAVNSEMRSAGIGSALLGAVIHYADGFPILIETEDPVFAETDEKHAQCVRRNAFYTRSGAVFSGVESEIFGVHYNNLILTDGPLPDDASVARSLDSLYRFMIDDLSIFEENIKIL